MRVSDLYDNGPLTGKVITIVGSGPSLSLFPRCVLREKTCLLLNDTCRYLQDIGPFAFANNKDQLKFAPPAITHKIVKGRLKFDPHPERDDNHVPWDSPDYYVFSYREPPWDKKSHHDESTLFREPCYFWAPQKGSVSAFAVQFCLWCNVKAIELVGCDCNHIAGSDYTHGKKNRVALHDYYAYQRGLMTLGRHAANRGIPMYSLSPFMGIGWQNDQFAEINGWTRL